MGYYVYVLKSLRDGRTYKGLSKDVGKRLKEHNSGQTKSTKAYCPWVLIYKEECESLSIAREREKYFKSGIGREFIKELKV